VTGAARAGLAAAGAAAAIAATVFGWSNGPAPEAGPPPTVAPEPAPPALDGAALFRSKGCAICHDGPDSTSPMDGFPDLSAASVWAGTRRDRVDAAAYLAESIAEPWAFRAPGFSAMGPTTQMPGLDLTEEEIDAVVTFLLGT